MAALYRNNQVKIIDQLAAEFLNIDSFELMQVAAKAVFKHIAKYKKVLVVTGPGNNGGDGWVIAELAKKNGQQVSVWALQTADKLSGDALSAFQNCSIEPLHQPPVTAFDCIVDAVFGSGLNQPLSGIYQQAIEWINRQSATKVAVDIPSGLHGDNGQIMGVAVRAELTVSILNQSPGLYTLNGKDCCGTIINEDLGVDSAQYNELPIAAELLQSAQLKSIKNNRYHNSHKGSFGHVWVAGGNRGMLGAVMLSGEAALRAGCGCVTVVSKKQHCVNLSLRTPELMTAAFSPKSAKLPPKPPQVVALGMGLGKNAWAAALFSRLLELPVAKLIDADGLLFLRQQKQSLESQDVITPHPSEAAMLLGWELEQVQADRLVTAETLSRKYNCVCVLKGSGTIISNGEQNYICPFGSDALATAGSGDVLSGIIAGLMAQGHGSFDAARLGVLWHALSGEQNRQGLCLTASDIAPNLYRVLP